MIDGVTGNMIVAIELIQKAIDPMVAKKFGRIVNITSGSVKMPIVGLDLSSGARAGLTAFLAGVARSIAASNVTINFVLPGTFETDRLRSNMEMTAKKKNISVEAASAERMASVPAKRFGQPDELGAAVRSSARHKPATLPDRTFSSTAECSRRVLRVIETPFQGDKFMKLVRYGAPGREKPGMIDKEGRIRDLSKIVPDIAGDVLSPTGLTSCASSSRTSCRW